MLIINNIMKSAISSSKQKANFDLSFWRKKSMHLLPKRAMHTALLRYNFSNPVIFLVVKKYSVVEKENKFLAIDPNEAFTLA